MTDCTHQIETLRHGLEALEVAKYEAGIAYQLPGGAPPIPGTAPDWGFIAGTLNQFRDHEAHETNLDSEAHQVLMDAVGKNPQLYKIINDFEDEFVKRAVSALVQCECQKGNPS